MGSKTKNRLVDALYLALAIVPFLLAMMLKVLTAPRRRAYRSPAQ